MTNATSDAIIYSIAQAKGTYPSIIGSIVVLGIGDIVVMDENVKQVYRVGLEHNDNWIRRWIKSVEWLGLGHEVCIRFMKRYLI